MPREELAAEPDEEGARAPPRRAAPPARAPRAQPAFARAQLFYQLYNVDIVFEDAYGVWREDLDNATPGKQQALIQVNEFLVWLETAAEDEED